MQSQNDNHEGGQRLSDGGIMNNQKYIWVDGIKWWVIVGENGKTYQPLCPQHHMRLRPVIITEYNQRLRKHVPLSSSKSLELECLEGSHHIEMLREYSRQEKYVGDKIDAQIFEKMTYINLDDTAVPVAKEELRNTDWWVKAKVTDSKAGTRLIVWAGSKAAKNKTQLFVEPALKRLSFDQHDDHPTEVFTKIEATFKGGHSSDITEK